MLDLDSAAHAIGAGRRGPNVSFDRVVTDSRQVGRGDLFVALRGERFDGHAFVDEALRAGAAAAMVEDAQGVATRNAPLVLVDDSLAALGRLAAHWRSRFDLALIGVTGSSGKTTVKEMIAGVLRAHAGDSAVLATSGNLNNAIGMPLMLLRLRPVHRYAVIEMGMNHLGELRHLTALARPTIALVTNAGTAHIGELGSREAIAQAKGEIYEGLGDGVAIINADDSFAGYWRTLNAGREIVEFGFAAGASIRGETAADGSLRVHTPREDYAVELPVPGEHNQRNALAAAAVAHVLGIAPAAVRTGLAAFENVKGRLQRIAGRNGSLVIDDSYNANPDSAKAAAQVLAAFPGERVMVLGDMGELGEQARQFHGEVGAAVRERGVDRLFTLGELSRWAAEAFGANARHFGDIDALCAALHPLLQPGVTVLVKGSRFMRMERVVAQLAAGEVDGGGH